MGLFSRIMKYADNSFHLNQSIFISDRIYGFVANKKGGGKQEHFFTEIVLTILDSPITNC